MEGIYALTIFACIFALGEYIALKTKATFSTVLVVAFILMIGFWLGLPKDIFDSSALVPIGYILIGILITGMGNLLDFAELKRQWKTVAVAIFTVTMATGIVFFVGQIILGRDLALAGAPIFAGSSTASLVMNSTLAAQGRDELALFVILMLVCQNFIGIPVASQFLKLAAKKFKNDEKEYMLYANPQEEDGALNKKRKLLQLPDDLSKPSVSLAKLALVTSLSVYISNLTGGKINYIIVALILGTVFTELGFLNKNEMDKSNASGFILFSCIIILFTNLPKTEPSQLVALLFPLIITLGIGVIGACLAGVIFGKIFKVEKFMAICMCLTCMFGFPTTMFMSNEVATAIGTSPEDIEIIGNYLRPKMVTAGFITGIFSIVIASFVAGII